MNEKFYIKCRVWGGVTGTRESLLKSDGEVVAFDNREDAQHKANALNRERNNLHSTAFFEYTVLP